MFEAAAERRTWAALRRVLESATGPIDLVDAVAVELGGEVEAPSRVDLHALTAEVPSTANAGYYAQRELERITPAELLERGADLETADLSRGIETRARASAGGLGKSTLGTGVRGRGRRPPWWW